MKSTIRYMMLPIMILFAFTFARAQTWNTQIVHSGSITGPKSLKIAPDGNPVTFQRVDEHTFVIVKWNGNSWQTVFTKTFDWWFGLNAVSGVLAGNKYIVALSWTDYGSFNTKRIQIIQINQNGIETYSQRFDGGAAALSVISEDKIIVTYNYNVGLYVKSYNSMDNTWSIANLVDGTAGDNIDITNGIDNRTWISYYDYTSKDLKVAQSDTSSITGWNAWTVDSQGDVGSYSSICVDQNNIAHIAYYDATNQRLKYAVFNP